MIEFRTLYRPALRILLNLYRNTAPTRRGTPPRFRNAVSLATCLALFAAPAWASTYMVTSTTDSGAGSLRDALASAASDDTINFSVTGTITLASGPLLISKNLNIQGPGASRLTISGNYAFQAFVIAPVSTVSISGLTIANGYDSGINGGGIQNDGTLTVANSTFSGNSADHKGGGIFNDGALTVTNSTFSGNSTNDEGGAIFNGGTLLVTNSTFSGNSAYNEGGGIANIGGTLQINNSIVAGNTASSNPEIFGSYTGSHNITSATGLNLSPLGWYGGPTQTMLPLAGSSASCAGLASLAKDANGNTLSSDQRGNALDTACPSGTVDAGAVQVNTLIVNTLIDSDDGASGCAEGGTCSLRDAITVTNSSGKAGVEVEFSPALTATASTVSPATILLISTLPAISNTITVLNIVGPGANLLAISGSNAYKVFHASSGAIASISGLTITKGMSKTYGSGIYNDIGGTLAVIGCTVTGNTSSSGGNIYNLGTLNLVNSTISGNTTSRTGGGILNHGTLTMTNSTVSGNNADTSSGGGLYNGGAASLTNSTISGNTGARGGNIFNSSGETLTLANSIVAGSIMGSYTGNSNITTTTGLNLSALGWYGGPTQTMVPLFGSSVLAAGSYVIGEPTTDQRGAARASASGTVIDVGAVQMIGNTTPIVGSVTPAYGPLAGGTQVTITGTGLDSATAVSFGGTPATSFSITAATSSTPASITMTAPEFTSAGTVDIIVTNSDGTSTASNEDQFTYYAPLVIAPASGSLTATYGSNFNETFTISGGSGSETLSVTSGALPDGLTLTQSGSEWVLSGTPTTPNSYSFSLTATDNIYVAVTTTQSYILTVNPVVQTISFTAPASPATYGVSPITLSATGGASGNPVTFTLISGPATISGNTLTITGAGTVVVAANQAGNANYAAATEVRQSIVVNPVAQTISFTASASPVTYGVSPITLSATGGASGNPVTFTLISGPATISGNTLTITGAGTVVVAANQSGNSNYQPAVQVSESIVVTQATLAVTASSTTVTYGATAAISPSYTGWLNGDTAGVLTAAPICSTTYTRGSPVGGTYTSSCAGAVAANYAFTYAPGTVMVTKAASATTLTASADSILQGQSLTLTAQVTNQSTVSSGTPTDTVSFYDGTTLLGTGLLSGSTATYTTSSLAAGTTHVFSAVYAGDTNFTGSTTKSSVSVLVKSLDFTLASSGTTTQTVMPGGSTSFTFDTAPVNGTYPADVTFAVTGLPLGATVTFSPSSIPMGSPAQTVTMTIRTGTATATAVHPGLGLGRDAKLLLLGLLLLPFAGLRRVRRSLAGRCFVIALTMVMGIVGMTALSGCGATSGFNGQSVKNYTITVTATCGSIQHSSTVNLNVQ